jgi:hypothetical protein
MVGSASRKYFLALAPNDFSFFICRLGKVLFFALDENSSVQHGEFAQPN